MTDKDINAPEDGDEEQFDFDPTMAQDAGTGDEFRAAEEEAKVITLRNVENRASRDNYAEEVRQEPNIIERGRKLLQGNLVMFPDTKKTVDGYIAVNCDNNRIAAFEALFGEGEHRPHINTFSGRLVDWKSEIIDDQYSMVPVMKALHSMGLRQQSLDSIRKSIRDWGLQVKTNDMILQFNRMLPAWDGVSRLDTKLMNLFGCFDTPLNRSFGKYFWLSLYCRITEPGCMAPMVLSLFGAQDVGKSYFSKLICRVLLDSKQAAPVQLDMGADKINFLRSITGTAIVANIGEMTGFSRTDLNDIKQFITSTSDDMHQKFEGHFTQQRQWIAIMDGNKYEGLQRDDTGNRRFYPMFVGQEEDRFGQPSWSEDFKADFTGFESDLWQLMAECRVWLEENGGMEGYNAYVDKTSRAVKEFSQDEMKKGRGAVVDYTLDTYLVPALSDLGKLNAEILQGTKHRGLWITGAALKTRIKYMGRGGDVKDNHLKARMISIGASAEMIRNVRGYLFKDVMSQSEYETHIGIATTDEDEKVLQKFEDAGEF
jgi:Virulence-associated protein E